MKFEEKKPEYLCVCGALFEHHMDRVGHSACCQVWADHVAGSKILDQFPRDKYGGVVIAAPAVLIALVREYLKEKQA